MAKSMGYKPTKWDDTVNVARTHPLKELLVLSATILGALALVYVALGFAVGFVVSRISVDTEQWLFSHLSFSDGLPDTYPKKTKRIQRLLDGLPKPDPLDRYEFSVRIVKNDDLNALALPGGHIWVFSGLVDAVESENELVSVLAHEMGHFWYRHHLTSLGRELVLWVCVSFVLGQQSGLSSFTGSMLDVMNRQYSQADETDADEFALEILVSNYGHAGGAIDFFKRVLETDLDENRLTSVMSTHPMTVDRIQRIQRSIKRRGYAVKHTTPLLW